MRMEWRWLARERRMKFDFVCGIVFSLRRDGIVSWLSESTTEGEEEEEEEEEDDDDDDDDERADGGRRV